MEKTHEEKMKELILALLIKEGLNTTIIILENLVKVTTYEDAIAALRKAQQTTWEDYKKGPVV